MHHICCDATSNPNLTPNQTPHHIMKPKLFVIGGNIKAGAIPLPWSLVLSCHLDWRSFPLLGEGGPWPRDVWRNHPVPETVRGDPGFLCLRPVRHRTCRWSSEGKGTGVTLSLPVNLKTLLEFFPFFQKERDWTIQFLIITLKELSSRVCASRIVGGIPIICFDSEFMGSGHRSCFFKKTLFWLLKGEIELLLLKGLSYG